MICSALSAIERLGAGTLAKEMLSVFQVLEIVLEMQ